MAIEWNQDALALLGTDSDMTIAIKLGVSHSTVMKKRKELGIPACHKAANTIWTPEMDSLVATGTDADVAQQLGLTEYQVMYRRRQLGKSPSSVVQAVYTGSSRVPLDADIMEKIKSLEPHLISKYQRLGVPIKTLDPSQVISAAIDYLLQKITEGKFR